MTVDNILDYPKGCIVGRSVPKTLFYECMEVSPSLKRRFVEDISSITWLYKLAPSTINVENGTDVYEIAVFLVALKSDDVPNEVFIQIDKAMPRHIVFIQSFQDRFRLLVNYKEWQDRTKGTFKIIKTFVSLWGGQKDLSLPIQGQTLDRVYDHIVRSIAGLLLTSETEDLQSAVDEASKREALQKEIAQLKKRMAKERQPSRKFELHKQILQLENQLK